MTEFNVEDFLPMPPHMGPPLPRFLVTYWPWYEEKPPGTHRLTIFRVGNGTVTPGSGDYEANTTITLTATPDTGAVFDHWEGDATGTSPTVDVLMDKDREVTAHFVGEPSPFPPPPPPPGLANLYGSISNRVTGNPLPEVLLTLDGMETYTDILGNFAFTNLEPGGYHLILQKVGFYTVHSSRWLKAGNNKFYMSLAPH